MVALQTLAVVEPMTFADFLRRLMGDRGISPSQVAAYAGVGRTTVNYWLRGVSTPERESVEKLAEALGLDRDLLRDIVEGRSVDANMVTAAAHMLYVADPKMVPILQRIQRHGMERAHRVERLLVELYGETLEDTIEQLPEEPEPESET